MVNIGSSGDLGSQRRQHLRIFQNSVTPVSRFLLDGYKASYGLTEFPHICKNRPFSPVLATVRSWRIAVYGARSASNAGAANAKNAASPCGLFETLQTNKCFIANELQTNLRRCGLYPHCIISAIWDSFARVYPSFRRPVFPVFVNRLIAPNLVRV